MKLVKGISPTVRIPIDDYRSIKKIQKDWRIKYNIEIGWIASYRKWRQMGSPIIK